MKNKNEVVKLKGFDVEIIFNDLELFEKDFDLKNLILIEKWYCAYVNLPKNDIKNHKFNNETYRKIVKDFIKIGVDTNHIFNEYMSLKEKRIDALKQISEILNEYNLLMKNGK